MSSPQDPPPADGEERLAWLERQAERAYAAMYDAPLGTAAAAHYSDAKELLADAIGLAGRLGREADVTRLEARLAHIKAVFRSQLSG